VLLVRFLLFCVAVLTSSVCRRRLFGVKCSGCGVGFDSVSLVMTARDRVYHVDCFRCVACRRQLVSGDEFAARRVDGALVCRDHFDHDRDVAAAAGRRPSLSATELRRAVDSPRDCVVSDDADATASSSTGATNALLTKTVASGVNSNVGIAKRKPSNAGSFSAAVVTALSQQFFGRPFLKRFALCYRPLSVCPVCPVFLSITFVHCGQTVGRIKRKLSMQVGLGPGHIVLDEDPAPPPPKGHSPHPIFGPYLLRPNGCIDQDATWYGARPQPRRLCVRRRPRSNLPKKGAEPPSPIFGPFLLWSNSCMHQAVTCYGGRPQPRGLCVGWRPSLLLNFRPMFIIYLL